MLILVAVTVNTAVNSGLFGHAKNATSDWKAAEEQEGSIGNGPITINGKEYASMEDYLKEVGNGGTTPEEPGHPLGGIRVTKNTEYSSDGKTAMIPAKFTPSGLKSEQSIDEGLVIYLIPEGTTVDWTNAEAVETAQRTYDQFVWIPIENINDMYMCQAKTSDTECNITLDADGKPQCTTHSSSDLTKSKLMAGRLYATGLGEKFDTTLTTQTYTENSGIREPDVVTSYDTDTRLTTINNILGTSYTASNFKEELQREYNEIVKSVYQNHGFYVGRYETSNITTTDGTAIKSVAGAIPSNSINWYYMYAQQRDYAHNNSLEVGSTMIQGAAYDQVMKFVNTTTYNVTAKTNAEHNFSAPYQTGGRNYTGTYKDTSKNIFDLEGNVLAWTTEAILTYYRVYRGGAYDYSISASFRYNGSYTSTDSSSSVVGSVSQLYIK